MDERDADRIVTRLEQIERRLEAMDRRLALAEGETPSFQPPSKAVEPAEPPPILTPAPPPRMPWDAPEYLKAPDPLPARSAARSTPPGEPTPGAPASVGGPDEAGGRSEFPMWHPAAPHVRPSGSLLPPSEPPRDAATATTGDELEYKIGRIGLLWAGAVVVVIGILYLVALAAAHTRWTPQLRFVGDLVLCSAFIAVGF